MKISIKNNNYNIPLENLIVMAKRANNEKRNFLFVSKVLGKHIEVSPNVCKIIGTILAGELCKEKKETEKIVQAFVNNESLAKMIDKSFKYKEKNLVIGFAETATGIGMAVASALEESKYITTTREQVDNIKSLLKFEEEHSHATTHRLYANKSIFNNIDTIVLVDDEITTGKSMLNIIKELKELSNIKKYKILSILDWRNKEFLDKYIDFQKKNNVDINVISLISGDIENDDFRVFKDDEEEEIIEKLNIKNLKNSLSSKSFINKNNVVYYIKNTGRFGTDFCEIKKLEKDMLNIAKEIEEYILEDEKVLVLGHGENIFIPSRIAAYIDRDVKFKTTTRSPIYCEDNIEYPIKQRSYFMDRGVKYYFYNKADIEKKYDKVILLTETDLDIKLCRNMITFSLVDGE
ncbi:MAG: phosphoribosyltransferase domain-containing protein [Sarcina sp.]